MRSGASGAFAGILLGCAFLWIFPVVLIADGYPDQEIKAYLASVDLNLSPDEELELKRDLVASGALDRLRIKGKKALTDEENEIYSYLTRPVRAKSEVSQNDTCVAIQVSCPNNLDSGIIEQAVADKGMSVIREWKTRWRTYFQVSCPPQVDPVEAARELEICRKNLGNNQSQWGAPRFRAIPRIFYADEISPNGMYIRKNRIAVYFWEPLGISQIRRLAELQGLVLESPRYDFAKVDTTVETDNATFFIADSISVGTMTDRLFRNEEIRNVETDGWLSLEDSVP